MGNSDMPEAMGIANLECAIFFSVEFFFSLLCSRHICKRGELLKHHLCGDSYLVRTAPVNKACIITHPREKRK